MKQWQVIALLIPPLLLVSFLLFAASIQIHQWGLSWLWAIFGLVILLWRWLIVHIIKPVGDPLLEQVKLDLQDQMAKSGQLEGQVKAALEQSISLALNDPPIWEDWGAWAERCKELVINIAKIYHPEVKYPLLNIYLTQAYWLMRTTVDDVDIWLQKLEPILGKVTVGDAFRAYENYQMIEPMAKPILMIWQWSQWLLNPAAALTRQITEQSSTQANMQLIANFSNLLKEAALLNLAKGAITLYSGENVSIEKLVAKTEPKQTQTLQEILEIAEPQENLPNSQINILLVGRTGAGKSSLINTLFNQELAYVDLLPSTIDFQDYCWNLPTGEKLNLWDSPGYEQSNRPDIQEKVLLQAQQADLIIVVTPALDPALLMDLNFLRQVKSQSPDMPVLVVVSQVDRLRPLKQWDNSYNWKFPTRAKEIAIQEAVQYRIDSLGQFCDLVLPLVSADNQQHRIAWGDEEIALALLERIDPAKQFKLARFLSNRKAKAATAAKIIEHYTTMIATGVGIVSLVKSPLLGYISIFLKIPPDLTYLLAQKIPVEQLPLVVGKLQMAFELFTLLNSQKLDKNKFEFDLLSLWPILLRSDPPLERNMLAFGQILIAHYTGIVPIDKLSQEFEKYLEN